MVAELLGLPSVFLLIILFIFTTNGQTTPPAPFPEVKIKYKGEVVYKDTSVYGVVGKAVILECGPTKPDLYIWSFTKPGTEAIKAVVYDLGRGPRPQTLAKTLGQVTVISNSAAVSIEKLPLAAHGLFTCQAFYDIDTEARVYYYYVHLTVRVPVSKPYLVLSDVSPVEGTTMWMRCKLDNGTGPIQYIWRQETRNGSVTDYAQTNTSTVNMTNINRNHTGWYRCVARNPVNTERSDRIWLDIIYGPDLPQIDVTPFSMTERGYSALERETVSLLCQAQSNPPSLYVWLYNNSQVASGSQFTITKVLRMHTGDYACLAQNTYLNTRSKKTISLTVYFGPDLPQIDVTPNSTTEHGYSVLEKENVSLLCQAESFPPSQYIWFYNNSQVYAGPELTITNILRMQTGDYTCWAQNTYLNAQSNTNISLTVYYPPDGSPSCSMDVSLNHTSLRLLCSWPGGLPPPTLNWNGEDVATGQETNPLGNTAILLPPEGVTYNKGLFTCSGSHPALKQPTECSIRTYVPPEEPLCFANVTEDLQYLMLSCSWDGGVPKALVRWEGPGGQHKSEEESSNTLVLLYGTARSDKPYTCHAKHPLLGQTKTCRVSLVSVSKPYVTVSNVNPLEGSNIWMRCNVENGTEPIQYVWQYESSSGDITVIPQSNTSMVSMPNINRNHTGWYDCLASNTVNRERSERIWLDVVYPPDSSPFCSMDVSLNHTSLRLLCSWPGGVPPPTLNWNGEDVATRQQTNPLSNTAILLPPEGVTYSKGLFTCSGSHPALEQPTECSIRTYVPPGEPMCFANVTDNLQYLTLSCSWDGGVPKALVRWEGPGGQHKSEEESSNTLVLLYGTARSDKPYTCHAKHPLLGQTKTCRVSLVSVSKPYISVSDVNPSEGLNIWMRCNVENGTRPIQYVWQYETQDGEIAVFPESNTSIINISNVNRDRTGWYRCVASNAVNHQRSDRVWLNVVYGPEPPQIVMTPSNMTRSGYSAVEKQRVSLLCEAQSNPASQYIWFFNNSQIYTGAELTMSSVQRTQSGDYACLAQNTFLNTRSKKTIRLTVYYPPNGSPSCSVEAAVNHTSLKLLCFWAGGFPPPALTWNGDLRRMGPEQLSTQQKSNRNTAMVLHSEGISSNSSFTCIGSHPVLKQPTGCIIHTYVPPAEPVCFAYVTNNKQYLMLSCSWDGGVPKALVWWEGPGGQNKGGQENSNILIIRYGNAHSHKPYTCHAKHPLLGQTKTCRLTLDVEITQTAQVVQSRTMNLFQSGSKCEISNQEIFFSITSTVDKTHRTQEAPVLLTQRRVVSVYEGTDVQLTCNLRSNYLPTNEITWFNNHGKGIQDTPKYVLLRTSAWANLTVRDTDERQDSGEYRCTSSNAVGGTEVNVTLVVKRHPMPPNATLVTVMYNSRHRNQVELEWQVHEEEENQGKWTGFILEHRWVSERPERKSNSSNQKVKNKEKISQIVWYRNVIQDPESRSHTVGSLTPTVTYQFRIIPFNHRTLGHPSAPKTPAEPRHNSLPAIIGAAIGGMLFAAIVTVLLLIFLIRNRNNNPRLHDMLFGMQHGQSRENINFPEDEVVGGAEGGIEDIGGLSSSGPSMAIPRASSPLTVTPQSATPSVQAPPPGDDNEPVNVTITVKATGS